MSAHFDAVNAYRLLGVDPSAPNDLVNTAYWLTASELQKLRAVDESVDATLYTITRSYELVASPQARAAYDESIGLSVTPVMVRPLSQIRRSLLARLLRRPIAESNFDYYEIVGLDSTASDRLLPEAYKIMRDHYLLAPDMRRRARLLSLLEEAYGLLSDREERERYDARRQNHTQSTQTTDPSTSNLAKKEAKQATLIEAPEPLHESVTAVEANRPVSDAPLTPTEPRTRAIGLALAKSVTAVRHALGSVSKMGKRFWNWETRLRVPRVVFRKEPAASAPAEEDKPAAAPIEQKSPPRAVPFKGSEAEEAFLGRLASRVERDSHPDDPDSGN